MASLLHFPDKSHCPDRSSGTMPAGVGLVDLLPGQRLRMDDGGDRFFCVLEGIVAVAFDDDDVILTPGDQLSIAAGEHPRVWNAGDEAARVVAGRQSAARLRAA